MRIRALIGLNNKYYRDPELSVALGVATSRPGLSLEKVINLADHAMYRNKGEHYRRRAEDQWGTKDLRIPQDAEVLFSARRPLN